MKVAILVAGIAIAASSHAAPVRGVVINIGNGCDEKGFAAIRASLNADERNAMLTQSWHVLQYAMDSRHAPNMNANARKNDEEKAAACLRIVEGAIADGGNPSAVLAADSSVGDPQALEYLLSKGANPAAKDPVSKASYGMLAIQALAKRNFRGDLSPVEQYLSMLLPRMGNLKTLTDGRGVPVVDYAMGLGGGGMGYHPPAPETVGLIIKRLAAAGVAVSKPYKNAMGKVSALQYYNGTDPEVIQLLTPKR